MFQKREIDFLLRTWRKKLELLFVGNFSYHSTKTIRLLALNVRAHQAAAGTASPSILMNGLG